MAGIIGIRAEDMEQVDALQRAKLQWPNGLPLIRPHVLAPVLVRRGEDLDYVAARFGFSRRFSSFNARDDKIATSPFWRSMFGKSHGVVGLSYIVEWLMDGDVKQPYLLQRADGRLILAPALVGPYHEDRSQTAFALCTRPPNAFVAGFHDRMVGVCTPELMERWLHPEASTPEALLECIRSPEEGELVAAPSSPAIQKRKAGDWSALPVTGPVLRSAAEARGSKGGTSTPRSSRT